MRRKKALKKEFRREVRRSLNRFLSIFFIVAMGVAFYSGIYATAPDLRATGDYYFDLTNLMDVRVISTFGLTEGDLAAIGEIEGVELAAGCYMEDVLCGLEDSQSVLHIESIPEQVNLLTPEEGSLPTGEDECFLDSSFAAEMGYQVGDTLEITVSSEDDSTLKYRSFTISGIGYSPCYISFSRGSSTLGTGSVAGFVYVLPEAFDSEAYGVAYVRVEGSNEAAAFDEEYEVLVEAVYDRIEAIADARCEIRYEEIMSEAQSELDEAKQEIADGKQELEDAKKELEDGRIEAESELAEAESELTQGESELADGKKEVEDAKKEIQEGESELAEGEAEIAENEETLADAKAQISDARSTLASGEAEYSQGLKDYQSSYASAVKELKDAQTQIDSGRQQLADGWAEYEKNKTAIADGEKQIAAAEKELAAGQAEYDAAYKTTIAQLDEGMAAYEAGAAELAAGRTAYEAGKTELNTKQQEYNTGRAQLDAGWTQYNSGIQQLSAGQTAYDQAVTQAAQLQSAYEQTAAQIPALQSGYDAAAAQNSSLHAAYDAKAAEVAGVQSAYDAAAAELSSLRAAQSEAEQLQTTLQSQQNAKSASKTSKESELADAQMLYNNVLSMIQEKEANGKDASAEQAQAASLQQIINNLSAEISALESEIAGLGSQIAAAAQSAADAKAAADAKEQSVAAKKQELDNAYAALAQPKAELDASDAALAQQKAQLDSVIQGAAQQKAALDTMNAELAAQKTTLEQSAATLAQTKTYLEQQEQTMAAAKTALDQGWAQLAATEQELAAGEAQLAASKQQLDDGYAQLEAAAQELADGKAQLAAKKAELQAGKQELEKGKKTLEDSAAELDAAQKQVDDGYAQLASARQQLTSARSELDLGWAQLNASQAQLSDGEKQLSDARTQLSDARTELADAKQKILDAEKEIAENEQKIKDGWVDYEEGKLEAEQKIADAEKEIADAEQEILDAENEIADAEKELAEIKIPTWYVNDRAVLPEYSGFDENAERIANLGKVFPVIFFLVAALISLTTMTRMVEEERTQIGTMKALGYSKMAIASKYLKYAFYATIGGSIFGVLFGEKVFPWVIIISYGIMYEYLPKIVIPYNWSYGAIAAGASLLCTMGATLSACYRTLQDVPAQLMRPPAPKDGKRVLLEYIPFIWRRLGFNWKSTIRNLMRYKKRCLMTIIGISGCMGLLLVGYGLKDSIMGIGTMQFEELQLYDAMAVYDVDADGEEIQEVLDVFEQESEISCADRYYVQLSDIQSEGISNKEWSIYLYVPENPENISEYFIFRDRETLEYYELTDEGAVITEKMADIFDIEPGDTLLLKREGEEDVEIPIAYVCENYLSHYLYMTPALYEQVYGGAPEYNSMMFKCDGDEKALQEIGSHLLEKDAVLNITYASELLEQIEYILGALDLVVFVLILSAGALAFVVLYNLNNININERKRELATIKVLGFHNLEVAAYVYRENILLTIAGAAAGIFVGKFLHSFIITTVEVESCMFARTIKPMSFLYGTLFTFLFSIIVNFVMYFKLKKIDMVESLKSIE